MKARPYTPEEIETIKQMRLNKRRLSEIAESVGRTLGSVSALLHAQGVSLGDNRRMPFTPEEDKYLLEGLSKGLSVRTMSRRMHRGFNACIGRLEEIRGPMGLPRKDNATTDTSDYLEFCRDAKQGSERLLARLTAVYGERHAR